MFLYIFINMCICTSLCLIYTSYVYFFSLCFYLTISHILTGLLMPEQFLLFTPSLSLSLSTRSTKGGMLDSDAATQATSRLFQMVPTINTALKTSRRRLAEEQQEQDMHRRLVASSSFSCASSHFIYLFYFFPLDFYSTRYLHTVR